MDPRGVGLWDMQHISDVEEAIWALDHDEAGLYGEVSLICDHIASVFSILDCTFSMNIISKFCSRAK